MNKTIVSIDQAIVVVPRHLLLLDGLFAAAAAAAHSLVYLSTGLVQSNPFRTLIPI
jgi:hypothetical protein